MISEPYSRKASPPYSLLLVLLTLLLAAVPAYTQEVTWHLLSRDDGCVDLRLLVKAEKLPRTPVSPEDFARMMRERGEQVVVGPLPDSPPDFIGKAVQVRYGNGKGPVFVKEELCRKIDQGK